MLHELTRRDFIRTTSLGLAGSLLLPQDEAEAGWFAIVFGVSTFGLGTILLGGLILGAVAVATAGAVARGIYSSFGGDDSSSYASYSPNGWKEHVPPKPMIVSVSLDPKTQLTGDLLRMRALEKDLLWHDGLRLPGKGRLIIEEDGKMQFADTRFKGYARLQYSGDLIVHNPDSQIVITRALRDQDLHTIHRDTSDGQTAMQSLLGDIQHV